jgi:uncharacterized membrane protein
MHPPPGSGPGKGRIEALSDGVFAIAMTLLILDVKVPALEPGQEALLPQKVGELWPRFLGYVVSFLITGVFWVGQHVQLHYVRRSDRLFMWSNIAFLMLISFLPFSTALLGQYPLQPVALCVYGVNLTLAGLVLYGQLLYASGPGNLFEPGMDPRFFALGGQRILMGPAVYSAAILLAFFVPVVSLILYAVVPVLYILPGRVDRFWHHRPADRP